MPDDRAHQVSEELKKKTITPQDAIQYALVDIARDIAIIEPDTQDWGWWVKFLLGQMEQEANRSRRIDEYEKMINTKLRNLSGKLPCHQVWNIP
jgi:hypothetical protein